VTPALHAYSLLLAVVLPWLSTATGFAQQQQPTITAIRAGFAGNFKLGCWAPLEVELTGGDEPTIGVLTVTVPDGDGVPTTVTSSANRPVSLDPRQKQTVRLFIRMGQSYGTLDVKLSDDRGDTIVGRNFYPGGMTTDNMLTSGLPATNRLLVEFGPPVGIADLLQGDTQNELSQTRIARVDEAADLPTQWYGYEGVDVMILTTSRADLFRPLAQNPARITALREWVERGGKLVIFCGSQAEELLVPGGALSSLLPGSYTESVAIQESQSIEAFSGAEQSITPTRRVDLRVPMFENIRGKVLASARRGEMEIPLVIRSYLGFGELTFIGLDFDRPPLADWAGRRGFLNKALDLAIHTDSTQPTAGSQQVSDTDIIVEVKNTLAESLVGVNVVPFGLVALLVIAYILLIGPGDYYLVNKVFKRPEVTWISFPLAVIGVSAAAYWFANWQKGDQLRVNQVEFIDVAENGFTRGTVWTHFFTPQVAEFDLSFRPAFLNTQLSDNERIVGWLGQPGYGLGGMQGGGQSGLFDRGYRFDPPLEQMLGVPVQLWSTKSITSRWSSSVDPPLSAQLNRTDDQLVVGQILNNSDIAFKDCVLLYGQWAWNLGTLGGGLASNMTDAPQPRTVRTLLTNATAGETTITDTVDDGTVRGDLVKRDMTRLAKVIMFFDAINGERYIGMLSRYQAFLDMSHLLNQPDLAIVIARAKPRESIWFNGDKPLENDDDRSWTYYRFVLPVGPLVEQ
jgi:hypothetical protein